ncbi:hypothetical protein [Mycoplasmopsis bovirhinis]|uniref:Uncharacterized protein n=1 Tax=Mycoplasmopsis bovirhinis TaxID=29553 RepID=A0A449AE50_9BACT|nr:hypothetical protein [Mycoplasmopsis bovirhinis]VEU63264.1 Uncharacterised protein [Mycoplasmopsis bovirhinis]
MKINKNKFKKISKYSVFNLAVFALPINFGFTTVQLNTNLYTNGLLNNSKIEDVNITNSLILRKSKELETQQINYGVNRFNVFGSFSIDLV